jgi:DNA-binding transcriptional MocR family regulator
MQRLSNDTAPEIEALQIAHLRQMPPHRKLAQVSQMTRAVWTLALAGLQQRYPQDTPAQRRRRLAELLWGDALAQHLYGSLPEAK